MIVRARIASFEVSVLSTQRGSVWSVRNVEWWIPEARSPSQRCGGDFFRKFTRRRRFLGIFLDFFQNFFGHPNHLLDVSCAMVAIEARRGRRCASARSFAWSRSHTPPARNRRRRTSYFPIPVRDYEISTGRHVGRRDGAIEGKNVPCGASCARSIVCDRDASRGDRVTSKRSVEVASIASRNAEMLAFVVQTYSDG